MEPPAATRLAGPKKKEERKEYRLLENEGDREPKRAQRAAAREFVAGFDWSVALQETGLEPLGSI
jgi:hypothetical protein